MEYLKMTLTTFEENRLNYEKLISQDGNMNDVDLAVIRTLNHCSDVVRTVIELAKLKEVK